MNGTQTAALRGLLRALDSGDARKVAQARDRAVVALTGAAEGYQQRYMRRWKDARRERMGQEIGR